MDAEQWAGAPATEPPRFRVTTPDDWEIVRTDAAHWQVDTTRLLDRAADAARVDRQTRTALQGVLEDLVYAAQQTSTVLLMLRIGTDAGRRLFLSSLALTLISTAPDTADLRFVRAALDDGPDAPATPDVSVEEFETPHGTGLLRRSRDRSPGALPDTLTDNGFVHVAQAYLPIPASTWTALATCTMLRAEHAATAGAVARRLVSSLEKLDPDPADPAQGRPALPTP